MKRGRPPGLAMVTVPHAALMFVLQAARAGRDDLVLAELIDWDSPGFVRARWESAIKNKRPPGSPAAVSSN